MRCLVVVDVTDFAFLILDVLTMRIFLALWAVVFVFGAVLLAVRLFK